VQGDVNDAQSIKDAVKTTDFAFIIVLCVATKLYKSSEIADALSKATDKTVKWVQIPEDQFRQDALPEDTTAMLEMFQQMAELGYHGPKSVEKVKQGGEETSGRLTTLEDCRERNPIKLE
jgi:hypothetical protein